MQTEKRLSELRVGEKGKVIRFDDEELSLKLLEMGCLPGYEIEMHGSAPLGDPLCISVYGYKLAIRLKEANTVWVA